MFIHICRDRHNTDDPGKYRDRHNTDDPGKYKESVVS